MITEEEKARRREAWEFAIANVELEGGGITVSKDYREIVDKQVNGEITME